MSGLLERLKRRVEQSAVGRFARKYADDRADDQAALIAFHALFSIFPLLAGLLAIMGLVLQDQATFDRVVSAAVEVFPSQLSSAVGFIRETRDLSGLLSMLSLVGLFWSGANVFGTMEHAFDRFYGLPDRGFVRQKLMAFQMIVLVLVLGLVAVLAASLSTALLALSTSRLPFDLPEPGLAQALIGWGISLGAAFLLFTACFRVVPNAPLGLRHVWEGALLSAVLFELLSQLFPIYLHFFGGSFQAYKTIGLFLLLMTWFYLLARILVLGAELNAFRHPWLETSRATDPAGGETAAADESAASEPVRSRVSS
jgi:membrane protein